MVNALTFDGLEMHTRCLHEDEHALCVGRFNNAQKKSWLLPIRLIIRYKKHARACVETRAVAARSSHDAPANRGPRNEYIFFSWLDERKETEPKLLGG